MNARQFKFSIDILEHQPRRIENLLKALDYINEAAKEQEYYEKYMNEDEDYFGGNLFAIRGSIYLELPGNKMVRMNTSEMAFLKF